MMIINLNCHGSWWDRCLLREKSSLINNRWSVALESVLESVWAQIIINKSLICVGLNVESKPSSQKVLEKFKTQWKTKFHYKNRYAARSPPYPQNTRVFIAQKFKSLESFKTIRNKEDTCLMFSILGRRYFGRSFLQLHWQCIMQIPTDDITVIINGTMKKCIIVFTWVSRL